MEGKCLSVRVCEYVQNLCQKVVWLLILPLGEMVEGLLKA